VIDVEPVGGDVVKNTIAEGTALVVEIMADMAFTKKAKTELLDTLFKLNEVA
jgi:hypothetical protein